jgi:DNA-binding NarL/FixJ family response regulator
LSGQRSVAASFVRDGTCCLVLSTGNAMTVDSTLGAVEPRELRMLERVLVGEAQKVIALECGVAASTVTTTITQCMRKMGMACPSSRIPVFFMMAARAATLENRSVHVRLATFEYRGQTYAVVSARRPDPTLLGKLSTAERELVDLLVERHTNAEIARIRATSNRTVANQIANVLRKLRVAGRTGIVSLLVARWCEASPARAESPKIDWDSARLRAG